MCSTARPVCRSGRSRNAAVPKDTTPGEWYSPTQPFPTKPPAFDRQGASVDDLIDFTPELHAQALQVVSKYKLGPMFTPPTVSKPEGPCGTLAMATAGGGSNWPGGAYDPETHRLFVVSQSTIGNMSLVPTQRGEGHPLHFRERTGMRRGRSHGARAAAGEAAVRAHDRVRYGQRHHPVAGGAW